MSVLGGAAAGLALSPWVPLTPGGWDAAGAAAAAVALAALARPRGWLPVAALGLLFALAGALVGAARLDSIDSGAARARTGQGLAVVGDVTAVPRRSDGEVLVELGTPGGRLLARAPEPVPELAVGSRVRVEGRAAEPEPWRSDWLRRRGIATVLQAERIEPTGGFRGGLAGRVDAVRERASAALARGMSEREQALARGFVLGEDDRIDPLTADDFRRSGLAHLLAVSGQNVMLLCLLAWPLFAMLGIALRARLLALLGLIVLYVAVTGAGPSIQRAGVLGAAGVGAGLASTPRSRWYALLLAVVVTLAVNPLASGDVGWQLSFAATAGIMLWSRRLGSLLAADGRPGGARRALADGVAVTVSATVATAPLMAHAFGTLSPAALPANLLALPAVAPSMWLGMLAGIAGQVPAIPVEPLNWLNSLLLAYIAQVAHWLAEPDWASLRFSLEGAVPLALAYAAVIAAAELGLRALRRRGGLAPLRPGAAGRGARLAAPLLAVSLLAVVLIGGRASAPASPGPGELGVTVLDVGQGDAILLEPPGSAPVLVDAGTADAGVAELLRERGVESLAALIVTHDQSDHAGGAAQVLDAVRVARLGYALAGPELLAEARSAGATPIRLAEGSDLSVGELRLEVLWPPAERLGVEEDPNSVSVVLVAEWRHFSMLLAADAEAELAPIDPGPVDVLKVAHHGSKDAGLGALLDRTVPKLAVISVGDNTYGHPTDETLGELASRSVATLRTDEVGSVLIQASPGGWRVTG